MNRFCLKVLPHLVITRSKPFRRRPEKSDIPEKVMIIPLTIHFRKTNGYI